MKTRNYLFLLASTVGLLAAGGCGKSGDSTPPPAPPAASEAPKAAAADNAAKTVTETPAPIPTPTPAPTPAPTADPAPATAAAATTAAASSQPAASEVMGILSKATTETKEGKYKDALKTIEPLRNVKLTESQQQTFDKLKSEIQTAIAKQSAGSAVGDILGGKK